MKLSVAPQSNKVVTGDDDNVGTETGNKKDETDTLERKDVSEQEIEVGILAWCSPRPRTCVITGSESRFPHWLQEWCWGFLRHTVDGERCPTKGIALITTCLVRTVALALGTVLIAIVG